MRIQIRPTHRESKFSADCPRNNPGAKTTHLLAVSKDVFIFSIFKHRTRNLFRVSCFFYLHIEFILVLGAQVGLWAYCVFPMGLWMNTGKIINPSWTFLTNHAHILLCLAKNPSERIRDIAAEVGITERAVQRIIVELEEDGYLKHHREGRRNVYKVYSRKPLRHSIEKHRRVRDLIRLINK